MTTEAFAAFIEQWHDFYLMAGTASVTLAGLLFVALSIHIDELTHDSREHLLRLSRYTLSSFVLVLGISLGFLAPWPRPRILGVQLIAFGLVFGALGLPMLRPPPAGHDPRLYGHMKRRFRMPLLANLMIVIVGIGILAGRYELMFWMVAVVCLLLGNAAGISWELLVRVARAKREDAAARDR